MARPRNHRYNYRRSFLHIFIFAMMFTISFLTMRGLKGANAGVLDGFNPGNIISDYVMSNYTSMTEAEIQAFLKSKNHCNNTDIYLANYYPWVTYSIKDGHFVCMADDLFDDGNGGKTTAAHLIWQAAQDYRINPQVLIVLLQKEQGLITDTWPNSVQYRGATGFGCPDTAPCDAEYYGLKNQLENAAWLFRAVLDGGWTNYPVGWNYVQYNPNKACGGTNVYIENRATSSLYRYTPYQPNASALAAGYGLGDACGAYGNRNFYLYFTEWFGNPQDNGMRDFSEPRYLESTVDGSRIHPYTKEEVEAPIYKGQIIKFVSKINLGDGWCYRTEHNTINNIFACYPAKYLKEVEFEYENIPEQDQMKIINAGAKKYVMRTGLSGEVFGTQMMRRFTKKVVFRGTEYYITAHDDLYNAAETAFQASDLTNLPRLENISSYHFVTTDTNKINLIDSVNTEKGAFVPAYTVRLFTRKTVVDGKEYYLTEYDASRDTYQSISADVLSSDMQYQKFDQPVSYKVIQVVDRINPITGEYYDTLSSGMVINFSEKLCINGTWYLRTAHNTANNLPYAVPLNALEFYGQ